MQFINSLHEENEKRSIQKLARLDGISIEMMFCLLRETCKAEGWLLTERNYVEIMSYIINLCDSDIVNYTTRVLTVGDKTYVCGCITEGEQAYHVLLEHEYADLIFYGSCIADMTMDCETLKCTKVFLEICEKSGAIEEEQKENMLTFIKKYKTLDSVNKLYPNKKHDEIIEQCYYKSTRK